MRFQLKYSIRKPFENKESWKIKQNGISALEVDELGPGKKNY